MKLKLDAHLHGLFVSFSLSRFYDGRFYDLLVVASSVLFFSACGLTTATKREPGNGGRQATSTVELCSKTDKEKTESTPGCTSTSASRGPSLFRTSHKEIPVYSGSSVSIPLTIVPQENIKVLEAIVVPTDSATGLLTQLTKIEDNALFFCYFIPATVVPGTYTLQFHAKGTQNGTPGTVSSGTELLEIALKVSEGVTSATPETIESACPDTVVVSVQTDTNGSE